MIVALALLPLIVVLIVLAVLRAFLLTYLMWLRDRDR